MKIWKGKLNLKSVIESWDFPWARKEGVVNLTLIEQSRE